MDTDEYINDTDDVNDLFLRFCYVEVVETEAKLERMRDTHPRANFTGILIAVPVDYPDYLDFKSNW